MRGQVGGGECASAWLTLLGPFPFSDVAPYQQPAAPEAGLSFTADQQGPEW